MIQATGVHLFVTRCASTEVRSKMSFLVPPRGIWFALVTESESLELWKLLLLSSVSSSIVVTYSLLSSIDQSNSWIRHAYLILQLALVRIIPCNISAQTMIALKSCFYVAVLFFALSAEAIKLSNFNAASLVKRSHLMNAQIATAQLALSAAIIFGIPASSFATPLGEHSGCSYPACTSQEEILKASAPGLIPQYEKDEQVQLLKDVEFTLKEFPSLVESKDYASIRGGFRSYPGNSLRLTARKVKNFISPAQLVLYNKAYQTFIDDVDYVDLMASQRIQKRGSDSELSKAVTNVNLTYKEFMKTVILSVPPADTAAAQL